MDLDGRAPKPTRTALGKLAAGVLAHRFVVVAVWAALALAGASYGSGLYDKLTNGGFAVPGSDSEQAVKIIVRDLQFGGRTRLFAVLEYPGALRAARRGAQPSTPAQHSDAARMAFTRAGVTASHVLLTQPDVAHVDGPTVSRDRRVAVLQIFLRQRETEAQRRVPKLRATLQRALAPHAHVEVVGRVAVFQRYSAVARSDLRRAERISFPVILAMLLVAFLSAIAAGIPLLLAATALAVTYGALAALSEAMTLSVFVTNTASILALGLSIDFSLFVVARFREELAAGRGTADALQTVMTTTGRSILLSGATVSASLLTLTFVGVKAFTSMAIGASLATLIATAVAVTLLPAILSLLGPNIDRLSLRRMAARVSRGQLWTRLGDAIVARPKAWLSASLLIMLALAFPIHSLHVDVRTLSTLPADDELRQTYDRVSSSFEPGDFSPIEVLTRGSSNQLDALIYGDPGVSGVPNIVPTRTGWRHWRVIPRSLPDARETEDTVERLRQGATALPSRVIVGGQTAEAVDLRSRIAARAPWVVLATCLIGAAVLMYGLRSIVVPVKAMLTTLLSTAATLGLLILINPGGGPPGGLAFFVPLFLFATVFGLSVDYEVFLLSRVREAILKGRTNEDAVRTGLAKSGRSITVAGAILAVVFLSLASSPLVPFQQLGLGLAIAVLLDVTVVRCVMVPAALVLLGKWNWWFPPRGWARAGLHRRYQELRRRGRSVPPGP